MGKFYIFVRFTVLVVLFLFGFTESQSVGSKASGCGNVVVKAEARTKYATTPGFPSAFPGNANCVWAIYSNPGKRIRLEFQKFVLLQPVDGNCEYHYVIVKSPFTQFSMGPYCGETGLPTIVSTGNLIYVELHTKVPVTTDNYQGFKVAFKETLESSSYELRPDNEVDDVIMTVDPETMDVLSPTPVPTTTPRTPKSTTKPWRFIPSKRPLLNTRNRPARLQQPLTRRPIDQRRPIRPGYVSSNNQVVQRSTPRTKIVRPKSKQPVVKIEIIVAIAVGGLVAVAIIIMIALKMMTRKSPSNDRRTEENKKSKAAPAANGNIGPKSEHELPGIYPDPNQQHQYWYDENGYAMAYPPIAAYPEQMQMEVYNGEEVREKRRKPKRNRRKRQR